MSVLAVDVSNYTTDPLPTDKFKSQGVSLVIIQAFPPRYHQYAQQVAQVKACKDDELDFDFYIYDYLESPGWRDNACAGLNALVSSGYVARRLWADEEDTTTKLSASGNEKAIAASLAVMDKVPTRLGLTGIYTGAWYWTGRYLRNSQAFSDRPLWDADYDSIPDTTQSWQPYGGWTSRAIKQYAGTQPDGSDLDVLSVDEAISVQTQNAGGNMAIRVGQGMADHMQQQQDTPLCGYRFYSEVDSDGHSYDVEQCYGSKGLYLSSNSSGQWVNAGPF